MLARTELTDRDFRISLDDKNEIPARCLFPIPALGCYKGVVMTLGKG
jgi:hypothetical protein